MQSRSPQPDPPPSSFRAAFSRARVEALEATAGDGVPGAGAGEHGSARESGGRPVRRFEVRIEQRHGKRKAQEAAWNGLGRDGWELVAVTEEHAFFRRERT